MIIYIIYSFAQDFHKWSINHLVDKMSISLSSRWNI